VQYTCADVSKATKLLGYKSKVPFDEGIRRTTQWYNEAYNKKEIVVCPELQANGLGRAASLVDLNKS
jgi:UDP-glucuronate 4-epimerase